MCHPVIPCNPPKTFPRKNRLRAISSEKGTRSEVDLNVRYWSTVHVVVNIIYHSYLCTCCLYGAERNGFDADKSILIAFGRDGP
jgi:hypothetical protein